MTNEQVTPQTSIDWDALLNTLEWDDDARRSADALTRLSIRAAQYAELTRFDIQGQNNTTTCVTFRLGKERYAVNTNWVRGVQSISRITRVPGAPEYYPGVVNMRGRIITLFDLRRFFGLTVDEKMPKELVQIEIGELNLGMLADHIEGVEQIPDDEIEPIDMLFARGITTDRLVILDLEKMAQDSRLVVDGTDEAE
ncbi:MAG: chemotaxis protein CheW [Anaerolineae bacterium]|nr:chemotaxis protein CheW [Anaerolineae bacterium]MCA9887753.1 chemotaxis protein CheW [Anaerolineae bacterium]